MKITEALKPAAIEGTFHMVLLVAIILTSGSFAVQSAASHRDVVKSIFAPVGQELLQSAPYYS
jgi:hypothetical protein